MHARNCARRVAGLGVAIMAPLVLVGQSALGMNVLRTDIGDGSSSFKFAIINDIHYADSNSPGDLRRAIDTINSLARFDPIMLVMVNGDLANTGDTSSGSEWDYIKADLCSLQRPYVPLIGNHDLQLHTGWIDDTVYGPPPESLFQSRGFLWEFDTQLVWLESLRSPPIDSFVRYREHPWNARMQGWGSPQISGAHDVFESYAFKAGPSGSPYRFLCLDFNAREHSGSIDHTDGQAHVYDMDFNDDVGSVRVTRRNTNSTAACTLFIDRGDSGDFCVFDSGLHDLDPSYYREISSVAFGANCSSVVLYRDSGGLGNKIELWASDPDLSVNGPEAWWRQYAADHKGGNSNPDKLIIFAHHAPIMGWPLDEVLGFADYEENKIRAACSTYAQDIGGWFSGHVTPGQFVNLGKLTGKILKWPFYCLPWRTVAGDRICFRWLNPPCGGTDAVDDNCSINIVTLRWDPDQQPLIVADESGIFPEAVDATMDSAQLVAVIADGVQNEHLSAAVYHGVHLVRVLVTDTLVSEGMVICVPWDCTDSAGQALLPDDDYCVKFFQDSTPRGTIPFNILGAVISGSVNCELDTSDNPVQLAGNVTVNQGDTLLIRPGVRVMPSGDYGITVHGRLLSNGLPGDTGRILFTPYRRLRPTPDSCSAGAWKGIKVTGDGLCSLDYCAIEYAGGTANSAAVYCTDSSQLVMTNSVIRHSSSRGFYGHSDRDVMNRIHGDTFEYCASYPVTTVAESVHSIVHSCTFRNNGTKGIEVWAGTGSGRSVTASAEWLKCEPTAWRYDVTEGALDVMKATTGVCTLKVSPGVTIRIKDGQKLVLHDEGNPERQGFLRADGTSENPITFTGLDTTNHGNFWHGIHFQGGADGHMDYCRLTHVDGRGMDIPSGTVGVYNSLVRRADYGIWTGTSALTVSGTTFSQCSTGLHAYGGSNTVVSVDSCTFSGNYDYGLYCTGTEDVVATRCSFTGNGIPAAIRADLVSDLMTDASFSGNTFKGIGVSGGSISSGTHTWPKIGDNYIYRCSDSISVTGAVCVTTLSVARGASGPNSVLAIQRREASATRTSSLTT